MGRYENKYAIYQLKHDDAGDERRFMNFDWHIKKGITPKIEDYDLIYIGELPPVIKNMNRTLEQIYEKFNLDHPADFRGYSLSVSDVVAINRGGKLSYHFCDSAGFRVLQGFSPEQKQEHKPEHKQKRIWEMER